MTPENLSEEIIRLVYHEAVISDDPYVQEVAVQTSVQDLLEEFERETRRTALSEEGLENDLLQARADIRSLEEEIERQAQQIHGLKAGHDG